jgi:hypothetical protein
MLFSYVHRILFCTQKELTMTIQIYPMKVILETLDGRETVYRFHTLANTEEEAHKTIVQQWIDQRFFLVDADGKRVKTTE